jgi:hypothetical protein
VEEQDHEAILAAARQVLERDGLATVTTGELHRFGVIADSVDHPITPVESVDVDVRSARVLHADDRIATVLLDARIDGAAESVTGMRVTWKTKVSGPAQLAVEDGEWKVTDLVIEGESVLGGFLERDWSDEAGGVRRRLFGWRWRRAVLGTRRLAPGVSRVEAGFSTKKLRRGGMDVRLLFEAGEHGSTYALRRRRAGGGRPSRRGRRCSRGS